MVYMSIVVSLLRSHISGYLRTALIFLVLRQIGTSKVLGMYTWPLSPSNHSDEIS